MTRIGVREGSVAGGTITARTGAASVRVVTPRLVGRDAELRRLERLWQSRSALVIVEGEAGVGKTRLLSEFLARSDRATRVLHTCCPPVPARFTLGPLVDGLRAIGPPVDALQSPLMGALRPLLPDWYDVLPPDPGPVPDASAARHRLYCAVQEVLDRHHVAALVVEDVHWADEATVEFLLWMTSRAGAGPAVVVTYRREDVPAKSALWRLSRAAAGDTGLRIALKALGCDATADLVSSMLDGTVSDRLAHFVHDHTEGLPLAVEEVVRGMAERAELTRCRDEWTCLGSAAIVVPAALRDVVLDRANRLTKQARRILDAAAVLAGPIDEELLASVAAMPLEQARQGLDSALAAGLLVERGDGLFVFRHELAGKAIVGAVSRTTLRDLHGRAGRVLASRGASPALLARHFRASGSTTKWCRYAEEAADLAVAAGDETTADRLLLDLICTADLTATDVVRLVAKVRFADADGSAGYHELVAALRRCLSRDDTTRAEAAHLRCRLGNTLMMLYDYDGGLRELELAVPDLGYDRGLAAWAMTLLGCPFGSREPASAQLAWLRRAEAITPLEASETRNLHGLQVLALLMLGEPAGWIRADQIPTDSPETGARLQIARNNLNVGHAAVFWGRYDEAERRLGIARRISARHGYRRTEGATHIALAHLDWFRGRWDGLRARAESLAADEQVASGARREAALVSGLLNLADGLDRTATTRLSDVVDAARAPGQEYLWVEAAGAFGAAMLRVGDAAAAEAILAEPAALVTERGLWLWATELASPWTSALLVTGRSAEAVDFVRAFAAGLGSRPAPGAQAALLVARALLAKAREDWVAAAELFAAGASAWAALPRPYDALRCGELRAESLLAAGEQEASKAELAEALSGLWTLGATAAADRVARRLRGLGVHVRRPGAGRPSYGDALSPREHDVVRLVASGRTDREIARMLFLSPRTVASHVTSARRKLNAPTRTALAVSAVRAGIAQDTEAPGVIDSVI